MSTEQIISIGVEVILFLIASYFLFYKSFLKELGKENAKLLTVEKMTQLTESVKKEFQEQIITHQIQFGFLHQERAKVITELYKKLVELHSAMVDWTMPLYYTEDKEKETQEKKKRANQALCEFNKFFLFNKLFLSKSLCTYVEDVFKEYWDKGWNFGFSQEQFKNEELRNDSHIKYWNDMKIIAEELRKSLPQKIEELEIKFRKLLNVEE